MNDLPVGRSVDETLRLVQAFQFTDEHGEVCPAGWKPGDDTVRFLLIVVSDLLRLIFFSVFFILKILMRIYKLISFVLNIILHLDNFFFQIIPNPQEKLKYFKKANQ